MRAKSAAIGLMAAAIALLSGGCHKAIPHATASDPYAARQIHTLTHDEDLNHSAKLAAAARLLRQHFAKISRHPDD